MSLELDPNAPTGGAPPAEQKTPDAPPAPERPRNPVPASALPESALLAKKEKWQREAAEQARAKVYADLGVEDPERWKAEQARLREQAEAKRRADEEAARSKLDEAGRLRADLDAANARVAELEAQLAKAEGRATTASVELLAREAALESIDPVMYEDAREALRRHVAKLTEREKRRFDQDDAREFFADLAKRKPGFARAAPAKVAAPAAGARRPLTTGPSPARAAPAPPKAQPVTPPARPGRITERSSAEEVDAAFAKFGVRYSPPGRAGGAPPRPNGSAR